MENASTGGDIGNRRIGTNGHQHSYGSNNSNDSLDVNVAIKPKSIKCGKEQ